MKNSELASLKEKCFSEPPSAFVIKRLIEALETDREEIEHLKDVLHIDRSGLAQALSTCRDIANGWSWMTVGRGMYEWDDDEYTKEVGYLIAAVHEHCMKALGVSGDLVHAECCNRTSKEHPWQKEAREQRARAEALQLVVDSMQQEEGEI
jgi:hypothetical protein